MINQGTNKLNSLTITNNNIKKNDDYQNFRTGLITIVGRPNVGKSTLLNQLVGQKISITSKKAQTTWHRVNGILTDHQTQFIFVDTPGYQLKHLNRLNRIMNHSVKQSLCEVDVVLFVVEALCFDQRDHLVLNILPVNKPVILIINKIDKLASKDDLLPFMEKMAKCHSFASIIPVSGINKTQLSVLIDTVRTYLPVGMPLFDKDTFTDRSERFIAAEIIREKLFRMMGDEIPYAACINIHQFSFRGGLREIHALIFVGNTNQKAMIIGKNGKKIKLMATQARKEMERHFNGKVFLGIWVKIKKDWTNDISVLNSLDYE